MKNTIKSFEILILDFERSANVIKCKKYKKLSWVNQKLLADFKSYLL